MPPRSRKSEKSSAAADPGTAAEARRASGSPWFLGVVAFLCLLAGGAGGFLVARNQAARTQVPAKGQPGDAPALRKSVEPPSAPGRPLPQLEEQVDLLAAPSSPQAGFQRRMRMNPPFDAINSIMFDSADMRIRLARVAAVGREDVCRDDSGKRLACGLMARAVLQNFLRGKQVVCDPLFVPQQNPRRGVVEANCWVNGEDLALRQISAGYAFPWRLATDADHAALAAARAARVGVWAGPHELPAQDVSDRDAAAIPFGSTRLPSPDVSPSLTGE